MSAALAAFCPLQSGDGGAANSCLGFPLPTHRAYSTLDPSTPAGLLSRTTWGGRGQIGGVCVWGKKKSPDDATTRLHGRRLCFSLSLSLFTTHDDHPCSFLYLPLPLPDFFEQLFYLTTGRSFPSISWCPETPPPPPLLSSRPKISPCHSWTPVL